MYVTVDMLDRQSSKSGNGVFIRRYRLVIFDPCLFLARALCMREELMLRMQQVNTCHVETLMAHCTLALRRIWLEVRVRFEAWYLRCVLRQALVECSRGRSKIKRVVSGGEETACLLPHEARDILDWLRRGYTRIEIQHAPIAMT